jgi:hypothetical protein
MLYFRFPATLEILPECVSFRPPQNRPVRDWADAPTGCSRSTTVI